MQFRIITPLSETTPLAINGRADGADVLFFTISWAGQVSVQATRPITSAEARRVRGMFHDVLTSPTFPILRTVVRDDDEVTLSIFLMSAWNNDGVYRKFVRHQDGTWSDGMILSFETIPQESVNTEVRNGTLRFPETEAEAEDGPDIITGSGRVADAPSPVLIDALAEPGKPDFWPV